MDAMTARRPLIGITTNLPRDEVACPAAYRLNRSYADAFALAGAAPVMLPYARRDRAEVCSAIMKRLDGLVLSGGADIPAVALGEPEHPASRYMTRDRWESESLWFQTAQAMARPVLGICLGMQIIQVVAGGRLIQDIASCMSDALEHKALDAGRDREHDVEIVPNTRVAGMSSSERRVVASAHHQAIADVAPGYRVAARALDGIAEAIETEMEPLTLGVQWHPERNREQPDWLIVGFVAYCRARRSRTQGEV